MLYGVLFLSGVSGLGYEIVWMRMLSYGLGHEGPAVLATIAAFFLGLAIGGWLLDKPIARSRFPQRIYAVLEAIVGMWALVLITLIPLANRWSGSLMGIDVTPLRHWIIAFIIPGLVLLPATFSMGGTIPAMERFITARRSDGKCLAGVYAANTFGAVAGTLVVTFIIAPRWGYARTLVLLAGLNILCAIITGSYNCDIRKCPSEKISAQSNRPRMLYARLWMTGLLGMGYEVLIIHALSQILENTVYSFASILAVYLLGSATGAAIYQQHWKHLEANDLMSRLLCWLSVTCLAGVPLILLVRPLNRWIHKLLTGFNGAVTTEMLLALLVFAGPTILMGALFSHMVQQARNKHGGVGMSFSINTIGCSIAAPLFGVILVPVIGLKASLIAVGIGYLALLPRLTWRRVRAYVPIILAGLVALIPLSSHLITKDDSEEILIYREGLLGSVTVLKSVQGDLRLKVNDRFQMGGTASVFSDRSQGHIPLMLHPNPQRVLFLGLGTGGTLAAAVDYPNMKTDGVELVPEVIDVMDQFCNSTGDLIHNHQIHVHNADARRFVNLSKESYDVIIADLFHPSRDGAGSLYTLEHFNAIRSHLEPNGIFCQWLPLYQMNLDTLRTITRTFLFSFPETRAFITHYNIDTPIIGLIGANQIIRYDRAWFDRRVRDDSLRNELKKLRLIDTYTLLGRFIAGRNDLIDFAGEGPINTDDRPVVTYSTPSFVYTKQESPYKRLLKLLRTFSPKPEQIIDSNDIETSQRLMAYWRARNDFITLGTTVNSSQSKSEMIKSLAAPLLSIVQESPDFAAAYNPLLSMALNRSRTDKKEALELLHKLQQVNPQRAEAGELIRYISSKE